MKIVLVLSLAILATALCASAAVRNAPAATATSDTSQKGYATAIFAGGCFWSIQKLFDHVEGVVSTTAGYTGGDRKNPSYEEVSAGNTGHLESVKVVYDPKKVSYDRLLDAYWHDIDPTTVDQAFCDTGPEYSSAIFVTSEAQKQTAEASKTTLARNKPFAGAIVTAIRVAGPFYAAEDYHQEFYKKNPLRYQAYRLGCRRDARLAELWGAAAQ